MEPTASRSPAAEPGQKIVVTGGAGYIGSVLCSLLLNAGYRVTVLDNLTCGGSSLLGVFTHPNFEFIRGDIVSPDDVGRALRGASAVVHLAAIVGDPACARDPERAIAVNRVGSRTVLQQSLEAGVQLFLFASTCSNYGRMDTGDGWVDEQSPLRPVSLYAELKVEFEQLLLESRNDMTVVCLRFATAFGLSYRPRFDLTVNQFTAELVQGHRLEVYGEQFWRPYCHVRDLADACRLVLAAQRQQVDRRAFNVGADDQNHTKKQLTDMILCETGVSSDLVTYVHKDEDPRDYRVRCDKIHSTTGFRPRHSLVAGITEIAAAVRSGVIANPADPRYHN